MSHSLRLILSAKQVPALVGIFELLIHFSRYEFHDSRSFAGVLYTAGDWKMSGEKEGRGEVDCDISLVICQMGVEGEKIKKREV